MSEPAKKLKICLDTSVPNCLFVTDYRLVHTMRFWEKCQAGKYDIVLSPIFFEELDRCPQPKLSWLRAKIDLILFETPEETDEVKNLAAEYFKVGVTEDNFNDCLHIAYAVIAGCDKLVSWNFTHLAKEDTIEGVKVINAIKLYKAIGIVPPASL